MPEPGIHPEHTGELSQIEVEPLEAEGPPPLERVDAVSAVDGRYRRYAEKLAPYFSERALFKYRLFVESEYLIALSEQPKVGTREFNAEEKAYLRSLPNISAEETQVIKAIETKGWGDYEKTNHDVKATEYYLREKMKQTSLVDSQEWTHFALTSEDANNIAFALQLSDATHEVLLPKIHEIQRSFFGFAVDHESDAMLARTHGQPASPTTFGKEMLNFFHRFRREAGKLAEQPLEVKLNGATGNFNAHRAAYPDVDWPEFSRHFIQGLRKGPQSGRLKVNPFTAQIEPHHSFVELFDTYRRLNGAMIDFDQDIWRYISDGWVGQQPAKGETGSSTMPHKVNPINFENSEGRLTLANAALHGFDTLLQSRLQRDLSDSTVQREFGNTMANCLIGYESILTGLEKIRPNARRMKAVLAQHPEVVAEAIQTILRREGWIDAYELLKEKTKGKDLSRKEINAFVDGLEISEAVKQELKAIKPTNYLGYAAEPQRFAK